MPYEVRGGVALHVSQLWPFVRAMQQLELASFGCELGLYKKELKGSTLLDGERRKHARGFLTKGLERQPPTRDEFTAYGQACLEMARGTFQLLDDHGAKLFAAAIPRAVKRPPAESAEEYLRKDHVFLFERFFYHLESQKEHGILVMDEVDKTEDRRFVRRMERYFTKTDNGRYRTTWIVPTPFFVASELTYAVQAADLCIYCINWGFRLAAIGMTAPSRGEIEDLSGRWLNRLQFRGQGYRGGEVFETFGIAFVPNPYAAGKGGA